MELYKQTTDYTCATCSLMMLINHYKPDFKLNRINEFKIWRETANLPTRASSIYGMACYAKKLGLNVKLVLEEREYNYPDYRFKGYTKKEIDEAKYMSKLYAKEANKLGVPLEEREIKIEEIQRLLEQGKKILLRVNAGTFRDTRSTSKYLAFFKEEKQIKCFDPIKGEIIVTEEALREAMDTLQTKKKRDHRMIIFDY